MTIENHDERQHERRGGHADDDSRQCQRLWCWEYENLALSRKSEDGNPPARSIAENDKKHVRRCLDHGDTDGDFYQISFENHRIKTEQKKETHDEIGKATDHDRPPFPASLLSEKKATPCSCREG